VALQHRGADATSNKIGTKDSHMQYAKMLSAALLAGAVSLPALATEHASKDKAVAMVKKAVAAIQQTGADKACAAATAKTLEQQAQAMDERLAFFRFDAAQAQRAAA
jgi:hypothetical protein